MIDDAEKINSFFLIKKCMFVTVFFRVREELLQLYSRAISFVFYKYEIIRLLSVKDNIIVIKILRIFREKQ